MAFAAERTHRFLSLDGGITIDAHVKHPRSLAEIEDWTRGDDPIIARGSGLSYAAASFGPGAVSLDMRSFDQVLDFDSGSGLVHVQAGITLGSLHDFLGPAGFYLPIQPGYSEISVGGCVAADVHGKNPARDGTFISQVERLSLFHPDHGKTDLSRDRFPDIFALTCGGYGMTGVILSVVLRASRLPGAWVETVMHSAENASHAAALLRQHAAGSDFTYAWLDFAQPGRGFGRGYVAAIRFGGTPEGITPESHRFPPGRMTPERRAFLPLPLLYRPTIRAMNAAYSHMTERKRRGARSALGAALFTFNGNELYHGLFGRPGFHESQVIVPQDALPAYAEAIRHHSVRLGAPITLGAGKVFAGTGTDLRFDGDGICIAVNLRRGRAATAFLDALDQDAIRLGGRPNIIKDSRLPRSVFEATYPDADKVRRGLRAWDPKRRCRSELSERLGL